jgi:hypothetical protein
VAFLVGWRINFIILGIKAKFEANIEEIINVTYTKPKMEQCI